MPLPYLYSSATHFSVDPAAERDDGDAWIAAELAFGTLLARSAYGVTQGDAINTGVHMLRAILSVVVLSMFAITIAGCRAEGEVGHGSTAIMPAR